MVNARFPIRARYGFESVDAKTGPTFLRYRLNGKFTANPIPQIFIKFSDNCADRKHRGFIRGCYEEGRLRDLIATG
jgi:hypothetical protein